MDFYVHTSNENGPQVYGHLADETCEIDWFFQIGLEGFVAPLASTNWTNSNFA